MKKDQIVKEANCGRKPRLPREPRLTVWEPLL